MIWRRIRLLTPTPADRHLRHTRHKAKSWRRERRVVARIEATRLDLDIRFVATNIDQASPRVVYENLYCARGQAENPIKATRRTSPPTAPRAAAPSPTGLRSIDQRLRSVGKRRTADGLRF